MWQTQSAWPVKTAHMSVWTLCHTTQHTAVLIIFPLNLQIEKAKISVICMWCIVSLVTLWEDRKNSYCIAQSRHTPYSFCDYFLVVVFLLVFSCCVCSVRFPVFAFSLLFVLWASAWNKDWLIDWLIDWLDSGQYSTCKYYILSAP